MNEMDIRACRELRKEIFLTGYRGGMAHLASCFSSVEILYTLYLKGVLRVDPAMPGAPGRDRFVLSKGHAALALYACLWKAGFISAEDFHSYLQPGCHVGGEPRLGDLPGVEATTGSLGHGLPVAVGMALAQKMDHPGARTYVLVGDGESQEGSIWEAAVAASSLGLGNLVAVLDSNGLQKTAPLQGIQKVVRWREKWESFGWAVREADGHDTDALEGCLRQDGAPGVPTMVIAHTVKGKGVPLMEGNPQWHFKLPTRKELKAFQEGLDISDGEVM